MPDELHLILLVPEHRQYERQLGEAAGLILDITQDRVDGARLEGRTCACRRFLDRPPEAVPIKSGKLHASTR